MDKKKDISKGLIRQEDLKKVADQIDMQGGYRQNIADHIGGRAESLSDVIKKIKEKGGSVSTMASPGKFKKLMGMIPMAGAGMAAMSGDPAMAAEELAADAAGPAGIAYEALKPDIAGNPEEEAIMLAERDAMGDYQNSPAAKAAKLAKLKALLGK